MEDWRPVVKHLSVKQNENIGMQGVQELFFCVNNKSLEAVNNAVSRWSIKSDWSVKP